MHSQSKNRVRGRLGGALALALLLPAGALAASYTVTDLSSFAGGRSVTPVALNNLGGVVGSVSMSAVDGTQVAFLYSSGVLTELFAQASGFSSYATGINDAGDIVAKQPSGPSVATEVLIPGAGTTNVTLGFSRSMRAAINNSGQAVGQWSYRAAMNSGSGLTSIAPPDYEQSDALSINDAGMVAGYVRWGPSSPSGIQVAAYYDGKSWTVIGPPGVVSYASDINSSGQVAGWSESGGTRRAFLYSGGTLQDLGNPASGAVAAYAINDAGVVVGATSGNGVGVWGAVMYTEGAWVDLNTLIPAGSGLWLESAVDINNSGQIIGTARNAAGEVRGYLLTPVVTPEPAGYGAIAAAGLAVAAYVRRRRKGQAA